VRLFGIGRESIRQLKRRLSSQRQVAGYRLSIILSISSWSDKVAAVGNGPSRLRAETIRVIQRALYRFLHQSLRVAPAGCRQRGQLGLKVRVRSTSIPKPTKLLAPRCIQGVAASGRTWCGLLDELLGRQSALRRATRAFHLLAALQIRLADERVVTTDWAMADHRGFRPTFAQVVLDTFQNLVAHRAVRKMALLEPFEYCLAKRLQADLIHSKPKYFLCNSVVSTIT
jgi:hypothetical protein